MFEDPRPTGATLPLAEVKVLTPCTPSKMICLWNNFHALAARLGVAEPDEPLYFLKSPSAFLAHGETIRRPPSYSGNVVYEGELGIVIGKRCSNVSEAEAGDYIFGYTCVDDVTAADLIRKDPTFAQWARAKSFDTFGVFGPVIATGLDPIGPVDPHGAGRPGAAELPGQRHDLPAAPAGQLPVARHDAAAGRRDRLRHLDRGQRHARRPPHDRGLDRGRRHARATPSCSRCRSATPRVRPGRCASAWSAPARSAA